MNLIKNMEDSEGAFYVVKQDKLHQKSGSEILNKNVLWFHYAIIE